jgi:hypothetical protein
MADPKITAHSQDLREGNTVATSRVAMSGGFFYAQSEAQTHHEDGRLSIMDNETVGPFDYAQEAVTRAKGRVSDAVYGQAYSQRDAMLAHRHGPDSPERLEFHPFPMDKEEVKHHRDITHTSRRFHSISADATDEGKDPLSIFRRAAARGEVAMDDPRQLAAAYTHPNEKNRLPTPKHIDADPFKAIKEMTPGQDKRALMIQSAALRKERDSGMSKAQFAQKMEEFGMSVAKKGDTSLAVSCFMSAFQNAREHTRERGPDIRNRSRKSKSAAER